MSTDTVITSRLFKPLNGFMNTHPGHEDELAYIEAHEDYSFRWFKSGNSGDANYKLTLHDCLQYEQLGLLEQIDFDEASALLTASASSPVAELEFDQLRQLYEQYVALLGCDNPALELPDETDFNDMPLRRKEVQFSRLRKRIAVLQDKQVANEQYGATWGAF